MIIEGRNSVAEAINSDIRIEKLLIANNLKDSAAQKIIDEAKRRRLRIDFMDIKALDRESPAKKHQGFIAYAADFAYCGIEEIIAAAKQKGEELLLILLDGIEDPHNLGSIIRVAECAGAHGIVIPERRGVSVTETVLRVSAGAAAHMRIAKNVNLNDTIRRLKEQNIFVYASDAGGESMYESNLKGDIAVVVGSEGTGVRKLTKELCDGVISIPLKGKVNSLNAALACGVVIYEVLRQRIR